MKIEGRNSGHLRTFLAGRTSGKGVCNPSRSFCDEKVFGFSYIVHGNNSNLNTAPPDSSGVEQAEGSRMSRVTGRVCMILPVFCWVMSWEEFRT